MSSPNSTTTAPFRLSRDEAFLIRSGLLRVIAGCDLWKYCGSSRVSPLSWRPTEYRINQGDFNEDCQNTVVHLAKIATGSFTARSRRLRLDPIELAACLLGVRVTEMMYRHGHFRPAPRDYKIRCQRLLKRLERLRKRAKRAYIRVHGQAAFAEASRRWQEHVRFIRFVFLFCTCGCTRLPGSSHKKLRWMIQDDWMAYYRAELPGLSREIPPRRRTARTDQAEPPRQPAVYPPIREECRP